MPRWSRNSSRKALLIAGVLLPALALWCCRPASPVATSTGPAAGDAPAHSTTLPEQTNVDGAEHIFDAQGVPYLRIAGVGTVRNPAWVALYALEYFGAEEYGAGAPVEPDAARARACVKWLAEDLKPNASGDLVWSYDFDDTYNDVTVKAPWSSAFGQAVGIQALLYSYQHGGPAQDLQLAIQAAQALLRPISAGGLKFQRGSDIWFEEVPSPAANPPHILNGHMRALLALRQLSALTGQQPFTDAYHQGLATLVRWLPQYDNGYWLRYDLNPRKTELLFRINNPYGFALPPVAIDRITLLDPVSKRQVDLDVGAAMDAGGPLRIAGNDWSQPAVLDGRTVRRLQAVVPATAQEEADGQMHAPGTYFYLELPAAWTDNLRQAGLELEIRYKDEAPGNAAVQMRSIGPGPAFQALKDGDLLLSGSGQWRQWRIPLRPENLGYWVGMNYGRKHADYLGALAQDDDRLKTWAALARGYCAMLQAPGPLHVVNLDPMKLPVQTPFLPMYSLDGRGVVMQHVAGPRTHLQPDGRYDQASEGGPPMYHPFGIARQASLGAAMFPADQLVDLSFLRQFPAYFNQYRWLTPETLATLQRAPALSWLAQNARQKGDALLWDADFDNAYNDVVTGKPWPSAFFQSYIVETFLDARRDKLREPALDFSALALQAARGLMVPTNQQGVQSLDRRGLPFFEEVPGRVHVLNAHLKATATLGEVLQQLPEDALAAGRDRALQSLRNDLDGFDTGYWLRYDMNPKKELLFQLDWLQGDVSPLIESITLENPQTATATRIQVGDPGSFASYPRLSGIDWSAEQTVDGRHVRAFTNGYQLRALAVAGAARHNVFFQGVLPERQFPDSFDVPAHRLILQYKDVAQGLFALKLQAINAGSHLEFVPLRGGMLRCSGDGQWKQASFVLRPQDLGWYVGPDYQKFDVAQLKQLASQSGDWYLAQCAELNQYYLDAFGEEKQVILQPPVPPRLTDFTSLAKVVSSSAMYPGHGIENALDGDPDNNYAAAEEGPLPQQFVLDFGRRIDVREIELTWEGDDNYATDYEIDALNPDGSATMLAQVDHRTGKDQQVTLNPGREVRSLRFTVEATHGQPRILLRQLKFLAQDPATPAAQTRAAPSPTPPTAASRP